MYQPDKLLNKINRGAERGLPRGCERTSASPRLGELSAFWAPDGKPQSGSALCFLAACLGEGFCCALPGCPRKLNLSLEGNNGGKKEKRKTEAGWRWGLDPLGSLRPPPASFLLPRSEQGMPPSPRSCTSPAPIRPQLPGKEINRARRACEQSKPMAAVPAAAAPSSTGEKYFSC